MPLCEKVTVEIFEEKTEVSVCHCSRCRKWTAGPFFSIFIGKKENFKLVGEQFLKTYHFSSESERAFCKECGSVIYWKNEQDAQYSFNAELFPTLVNGYEIKKEYYLENKPNYYNLSK
ncbi:Uncharacterized conserved protein [Pilibacter termitis]|uniref:Uncharacterized conserved protein n=1 Tax=Pilibacter termitis TaxID=263852 RepID=A0A1T4L0W6_9ENTE|nr:GFA family protein [Pilibacter termitis]SJZ48345.1 Uncharacterized conserved protein [Pilibacter termitis]